MLTCLLLIQPLLWAWNILSRLVSRPLIGVLKTNYCRSLGRMTRGNGDSWWSFSSVCRASNAFKNVCHPFHSSKITRHVSCLLNTNAFHRHIDHIRVVIGLSPSVHANLNLSGSAKMKKSVLHMRCYMILKNKQKQMATPLHRWLLQSSSRGRSFQPESLDCMGSGRKV